MRWLLLSVVLSVVLTVLLNVGLRAFPDAGRRAMGWLEDRARSEARADDRRVRVIVPWKAMIIASVALTLLLNLLLWVL